MSELGYVSEGEDGFNYLGSVILFAQQNEMLRSDLKETYNQNENVDGHEINWRNVNITEDPYRNQENWLYDGSLDEDEYMVTQENFFEFVDSTEGSFDSA